MVSKEYLNLLWNDGDFLTLNNVDKLVYLFFVTHQNVTHVLTTKIHPVFSLNKLNLNEDLFNKSVDRLICCQFLIKDPETKDFLLRHAFDNTDLTKPSLCVSALKYFESYKIVSYMQPRIKCMATKKIFLSKQKSLKLNGKKWEPAKQGFIYLMADTTNGFTKIGYSKKPKHRERTLQSEKPTIELIWKKEGTRKNEKELHELFAHCRIRGEWFNLTRSDIELINNYKFKN